MSPRLPAPRRRRQLLDVALRVFADQGFHDASMNDIAEAAGVTKPVLYQHFGSKRELFSELLTDVGNELQETITKALTSARNSPLACSSSCELRSSDRSSIERSLSNCW